MVPKTFSAILLATIIKLVEGMSVRPLHSVLVVKKEDELVGYRDTYPFFFPGHDHNPDNSDGLTRSRPLSTITIEAFDVSFAQQPARDERHSVRGLQCNSFPQTEPSGRCKPPAQHINISDGERECQPFQLVNVERVHCLNYQYREDHREQRASLGVVRRIKKTRTRINVRLGDKREDILAMGREGGMVIAIFKNSTQGNGAPVCCDSI